MSLLWPQERPSERLRGREVAPAMHHVWAPGMKPIHGATPPVCYHTHGCVETKKVILCACGNWFCNHCGDHVLCALDRDGKTCWVGAA